MTLAGFSARNHPQQTRKRGPNPMVDDRGTDPALFTALDERFRFTIDVAASVTNAKCDRYFTPEQDGLAQPWSRERVWCNPPYSAIEPWVMKAWDAFALKRSTVEPVAPPDLIVMLLPANRTEQGWWQRHVEPFRDRGGLLRSRFLPGRPRFVAPDKPGIGPNERPPFGCCLLIWNGDPS